MALLARGQASGEVRTDLPLRLLRPLVLGPIEHILWEVVAREQAGDDKPVDVEALAHSVVGMLWSAIAAPGHELATLRRLRDELADALARASDSS